MPAGRLDAVEEGCQGGAGGHQGGQPLVCLQHILESCEGLHQVATPHRLCILLPPSFPASGFLPMLVAHALHTMLLQVCKSVGVHFSFVQFPNLMVQSAQTGPPGPAHRAVRFCSTLACTLLP